jgi:hypothetical protein
MSQMPSEHKAHPRLVHRISRDAGPLGGGLVIDNVGGLGILRYGFLRPEVCRPPSWHRSDFRHEGFLLCGDAPLVSIHANGCPTCAALLQRGCRAPSEVADVVSWLNSIKVADAMEGSDAMLERLAPVIRLLPQGLYVAFLAWHYPTDGHGRLFWSAFELPQETATASYHCLGWHLPAFVIPTQPAACFSESSLERARRDYQTKPALAYYLSGRLSALLDGHHRALAAAVDGESSPAITIAHARVRDVEPTPLARDIDWYRCRIKFLEAHLNNNQVIEIQPPPAADLTATEAAVARERLPRLPEGSIPPSLLARDVSAIYPTDQELNCRYPSALPLGKIPDEIIDNLLEIRPGAGAEPDAVTGLLNVLFWRGDARAEEVSRRVVRDARWVRVWEHAYSLMAEHPTPTTDDFFVDFLVHDDGTRPELKAIVDAYFRRQVDQGA